MTVQETGTHQHHSILDLVDFVVSNQSVYRGRERQVEKVIKQHIQYQTFNFGYDDVGISYALRYNIEDTTAYVLDLIIRKDLRSLSFIKYVIGKAWMNNPQLTQFKFKRESKYPYKKMKTYRLIDLFRMKGGNQDGWN